MPATLTYAKVSPSGNLMLLKFSSIVTGVIDGATYKVDGGSPVALIRPLWDAPPPGNPGSRWVVYPLGANMQVVMMDDDNPTYASFTGAGWSETGTGPNDGVAFADQFRQTSGATDFATYTFVGLNPGRLRVSVNLRFLAGSGRTTDALYTISDGVGVLATVHIDQTAAQPFDRVESGFGFMAPVGTTSQVHLVDLGVVRLRDNTLSVKVANAAGSGVLVTDCVFFETVQDRAVPLGATCVVDAPGGTYTTQAGSESAIVAAPAALTTDFDYPETALAFDPTAPRTMGVGYNKNLPQFGYTSPYWRDVMKASTGWVHEGAGAQTLDANGQLTALSGGTASATICGGAGSGVDISGRATAPRSGKVTVLFDYASGGNPPLDLSDRSGGSNISFGSATFGTDSVSGQKKMEQTYTMRGVTPLAVHLLTYQMGVRVSTPLAAPLLNVKVYFGDPPGAGVSEVHPSAIDRLQGRNIASVRTLDEFSINASNFAEYSHMPTPADVSIIWGVTLKPKIAGAALVSMRPVDITVADTDDALKWFPLATNTGIVHITTATPHGLSRGMITTTAGGTLDFQSADSGPLTFNDGNRSRVVPLTATTYLQETAYYPGNHNPATMLTLAGTHSMTGYTMRVEVDTSVAYEDIIKFGNLLGVGRWINVPHLMSDAGVTTMAEKARDGTTAGTKLRIEYSNEPWNGLFPQSNAWNLEMYHYRWYLNAGDPTTYPDPPLDTMEWYCRRAAQVHQIFKDVFTAAGRGSDIIRVMGAQAGWAGYSTQSICNYAFRRGITFDEVSVDTYQDIGPVPSNAFGPALADCDLAFQLMDDDCVIDLLYVTTLLTGRQAMFDAHRAVMASSMTATGAPMNGVSFGTYFANVKITSYEGGLAYPTAAGVTHPYMSRYVQRSQAIARHPRIHRWELARLQQLQAAGCTLMCRYTLDKSDVVSGETAWYDFPRWDGSVGNGLATENANPHDTESLLSETGGAIRFWASGETSLPGGGGGLTTYLHDTFAGTAGASIVGSVPSPVANGSDVWEDIGLPALVFKSGGGATSSASHTSLAFNAYALTGVPTDQTITARILPTYTGSCTAVFQCRKDPATGAGRIVNMELSTGTITIRDASDDTVIATGSHTFASGTAFDFEAVFEGTSLVVSIDDTPVITTDVGAAAGSQLFIAQVGGSPGGVTFEFVKVEAAAVAATSIAFSGPTAGSVGVASTNFTVTPNGPYSGTITPSSGGGGGTFTPGSLTWSGTSEAKTFTYTPASAGAKTITLSGASVTVVPSSLTYTASVGAATSIAFSGPSSGTVGVASTNFTLTPNGTITDVLTPSAGAGGGTFTPTTVTLAGTTPKTFTYTAASAGAKTITLSGTAVSISPASLTYTASATPSGTTRLYDTFGGTAGASLTGSVPNVAQNGSDVWAAFGGNPALVFASGGGATSSTVPAFSRYALSGVDSNHVATLRFRFAASSGVAAQVYLRRNNATDKYTYIEFNPSLSTITLGDTTAGTIASASWGWAVGPTYEVVVTLSGTAATVAVGNTQVLSGTTIAAPGTELMLAHTFGAAGAVVIESVKVETTAATATAIRFSGPAVGQVGVASGNFTATPNGPIGESLTPSDGGGGGTFIPSLIMLDGTTPKTFTYTANSIGVKTITLSGTSVPISPNPRFLTSTIDGEPPVAAFNKFNAFVRDLGSGVHNLGTGVLKVALTLTAPVATNSVLADLTQIAAGNGYTTGGTTSAGNTWTLTGGTAKLISGDVTFTATGGSMANFRYAALYNDTPTSPADALIGYWDYGSTVTLAVGESLLVDFDGTNGILTLA